jgi:hypothetical protein
LRPCTARDWLEPVRNTVIDYGLWKKRSLGLVFFVQEKSLQRFRLPIPLDYPNVIEEQIHGNTGHFSKDQLHYKAWESVEPFFQRKKSIAVDQFRNLSASDLATEDPQTAIQAAFNGRVDTLFVDLSEHLWGTCSPYGQVTSTHADPQPGDEDLLDSAAAQTLLHGGKVHAVEPAYMPGRQPLAALLRY